MFLKFFKNYFLKRKLKNSLSNVKHDFSNDTITTVGILIDESYFNERESLVNELISNGIKSENITTLVYKDSIKKKETFDYPTFSLNDIAWDGDIGKEEINRFADAKFDMLISYYDVERAALMLVSCKSKASFKVGFSTIDKRLNHFMITTVAENYKVFSDELFRYLKILNKL